MLPTNTANIAVDAKTIKHLWNDLELLVYQSVVCLATGCIVGNAIFTYGVSLLPPAPPQSCTFVSL